MFFSSGKRPFLIMRKKPPFDRRPVHIRWACKWWSDGSLGLLFLMIINRTFKVEGRSKGISPAKTRTVLVDYPACRRARGSNCVPVTTSPGAGKRPLHLFSPDYYNNDIFYLAARTASAHSRTGLRRPVLP